MNNLLLSPTRKYFRIGDEDDFVVLDGGRVIGRIFLQPQAPEGRPWFWTITRGRIFSDTRTGDGGFQGAVAATMKRKAGVDC